MSESSPYAGLLAGKKGLIVGVANRNSIAWACARALHAAGMELAFTYQGEVMRDRVMKTVSEMGEVPLFDLDVTRDEQIGQVLEQVRALWGGRLDFLLHSVAYAPAAAMGSPFLETRREDFATALDISAYSLVAMTQRAEPLMEARGGGAIVTMTYLGGERAIPGYNVMGVAKAALDASMRYLAADLGAKNIRVNAISAGPVRTLAARGIAGFSQMEGVIAERAPLKRGIEADDVGQAGLYLLSPMASSVTGTILYVDAGYHAMGL